MMKIFVQMYESTRNDSLEKGLKIRSTHHRRNWNLTRRIPSRLLRLWWWHSIQEEEVRRRTHQSRVFFRNKKQKKMSKLIDESITYQSSKTIHYLPDWRVHITEREWRLREREREKYLEWFVCLLACFLGTK